MLALSKGKIRMHWNTRRSRRKRIREILHLVRESLLPEITKRERRKNSYKTKRGSCKRKTIFLSLRGIKKFKKSENWFKSLKCLKRVGKFSETSLTLLWIARPPKTHFCKETITTWRTRARLAVETIWEAQNTTPRIWKPIEVQPEIIRLVIITRETWAVADSPI